MHVNFVFRHLRESFSSGGGAREELETESKVLHFSMKLPFSPRAKPGRFWQHRGSRFRILPGGMLSSLVWGLSLLKDICLTDLASKVQQLV